MFVFSVNSLLTVPRSKVAQLSGARLFGTKAKLDKAQKLFYGGVKEHQSEAKGVMAELASEAKLSPQDLAFFQGFEQHKRGNLTDSGKWYGVAALEGDVNSLLLLGSSNVSGSTPVPQNTAEALLEYTQNMAEEGDPTASYFFGNMFFQGVGVQKNIEEAKKWYRVAVEHEHPEAAVKLANILRDEGNETEAAELYVFAADRGDREGAKGAGFAYFFGRGVAQDYQVAEKYFRIGKEKYFLGWLEMQRFSDPKYRVTSEENKAYLNDACILMENLAIDGSAEAQKKIGDLYYDGINLEVDQEEAFKWYQKAAEQGNLSARFFVAEMTMCNSDDKAEKDACLEQIKDLASQGVPEAKQFVAFFSLQGTLVPKNILEAFRLYKELADDTGLPEAAYEVGMMYCRGRDGIVYDVEEGARYLEIAASQNHAESSRRLASMYYAGLGVAKDEQKAVDYLMKSGAASLGDAYYTLAMVVRDFKGSRKDTKGVRHLLTRSAEEGNVLATHTLGVLAEEIGDLESAVKYFTDAAEKGLPGAMYSLFLLYNAGKGVPKDAEKAKELIEQAAEGGDGQASFHLASLYFDGSEGYKQSTLKAEQYLRMSTEAGNLEAARQLGELYYYGYNFPLDKELGLSYIEKAAKGGSEEALKTLEEIQKREAGIEETKPESE
eukprot:TRINITY_DN3959_c0_g1_i2.p1 TRINITY_DN3959_c0_g1~~TRINITY_DN3959_c0_g1_i2.p1  ORF type:complete len:664 (-),score=183.28 TRINITY_DN3959_c0_g1_i2:37-2028(-)